MNERVVPGNYVGFSWELNFLNAFVLIRCCVFARLFPERTTKDGRPVSSYEDLLDFLQEKDPSIQRTRLSFGGKNIALWSVFPEG